MLARLSKEDIELIIQMKISGKSSVEIAKVFGVAKGTVNRHLRNNNFFNSGKLLQCRNCGKTFTHKANGGSAQKFCSNKCRCDYNYKNRKVKIKRTCKICNKEFLADSYNKNICSDKCVEYKKEQSRINKTKERLKNKRIKLYKTRCNYCGEEIISKYKRKYCNELCSDRMDSKKRSLRKRKLKRCRNCNVWHRKIGFCCSEECRRKVNAALNKEYGKMRYKNARRNGKFDRGITIERLIKRDGEQCYLCGDTVLFDNDINHPKYPTIEHVLAINNGGTHSWDNVKVACRECNTRKSTILVEQFMKGVD